MACILLHDIVCKSSHIDSESDPFVNFCGMYNPDECSVGRENETDGNNDNNDN